MVYSIISLAICILVIFGLRQFDKKQSSLEKIRRYVDTRRSEFETYYADQSKKLRMVNDDLRVQTSQSIATVKRLEELQQNYQTACQDIAEKHGVITELSESMTDANTKFQQIVDMSHLLEVNIKQIKDEAKFVDSVSTNVKKAHTDLDSLKEDIAGMRNVFQEENTRLLEQHKKNIVREVSSQLETINADLASAKKDADALLDITKIKLNDIYKNTLADAAKRASDLEGEAFETLKTQSTDRVAMYRRELEENINATKELSRQFKGVWQEEASAMVAKMQSDFNEVETAIDTKLARINKRLEDTESQILVKTKSLDEAMAKNENDFTSKINGLVSALNDKIEQLSGYTENRLGNIKEQTEYRFKKVDATVNEFQTSEATLKTALASVKQNITASFESYKYENEKTLSAFSDDFKAHVNELKQNITDIEAHIEELKAKSYDNVSEKLKIFEDEFFTDITTKKTEIDETIENIQAELTEKLSEFTDTQETVRKELETQYTADLQNRLVELAAAHKEKLSGFDKQIRGIEANLTNRLAEQDINIEKVSENLKADVETAKENAKANLKKEIDEYMIVLQNNIMESQQKIDLLSKTASDQIAVFEQEYGAKIETANSNFQTWKSSLDKQFDSARTLFNDKISSFGLLAESAIEDFQKKHDIDVENFKEQNSEAFTKMKTDLKAVTDKLDAYKLDMTQHSDKIMAELDEKAITISENFDTVMQEKLDAAADKVAAVSENLAEVKSQIEKNSAEAFSLIQSESNRLTGSMQELSEKQNEYLSNTKIFERTDELKNQLENNIKTLQAELAKLSVYGSALDEVKLKYEKFSHQNEETLTKIEKFMEEKAKVEFLEQEFTKLTGLSDSIERKQIELEASNDEMQKYQVQIRKLDDSITLVNEKYQDLNKKEEVLTQTISDISKAFSDLNSIDTQYKESKQNLEKLSPEIGKLQTEMENLIKNRAEINETIEKIKSLDNMQSEVEERMQSVQNSKEWLAGIESRLNSLDETVTQRIKLFATVYNSDDKPRAPNTTLSPADRQNIITLHHMGWTNEQIANNLKCTLSEIELILEFSDNYDDKVRESK